MRATNDGLFPRSPIQTLKRARRSHARLERTRRHGTARRRRRDETTDDEVEEEGTLKMRSMRSMRCDAIDVIDRCDRCDAIDENDRSITSMSEFRTSTTVVIRET